MTDNRHGTYAGAMAHRKRGEKPCPSCLAAQAAYVRQWRRRRRVGRCVRGLGWPA